MHAIVFGAKRAHHALLRVTRKPLLLLGLTSARFDMLCALLARAESEETSGLAMRQSDLRRTLGVTASVVSRMLRSLESLGLVARRRPEHGDRRQREVSLTDRGLRCIRDARQALRRAMERLLLAALCYGRPRERSGALTLLQSYLCVLRGSLGDQATHYYWWGPPDA